MMPVTELIWDVYDGDCVERMRELPDNSIDAVVTDPPYGLSEHRTEDVEACLRAWLAGEEYRPKKKGFMGRAWDAWVPGPECWRECYRVLKPGGFLAAFAGTRTDDLMGIAIRLAGFERRDLLAWLQGQGFPKSLDVSKAIDAMMGAEREVVGSKYVTRILNPEQVRVHNFAVGLEASGGEIAITAPATDEAKKWDGFGTALKPAFEPVILARKPLEGTVAENVLKWGTGVLNINGCRIPAAANDREDYGLDGAGNAKGGLTGDVYGNWNKPLAAYSRPDEGRWPANAAMDEEAAALLDAQTGRSVSKPGKPRRSRKSGDGWGMTATGAEYADAGGASRFFYCSKASTKERSDGLDGRNVHPTVKPLDFMRWLVRLVTPLDGVVLDPFAGSGTTLCAAVLENLHAFGVEQDAEHAETARKRVEHWLGQRGR